jgi:hypothetical protein
MPHGTGRIDLHGLFKKGKNRKEGLPAVEEEGIDGTQGIPEPPQAVAEPRYVEEPGTGGYAVRFPAAQQFFCPVKTPLPQPFPLWKNPAVPKTAPGPGLTFIHDDHL